MLMTLPNNRSGQRMFMEHTLALPACCPVSKNPRPGSTITIRYRAKEQVLEIAHLMEYLHRFVGGLHEITGGLEVRDMEGMLQRISVDCANAVAVPVRVSAHLLLLPRQEMHVIARGYPREEGA